MDLREQVDLDQVQFFVEHVELLVDLVSLLGVGVGAEVGVLEVGEVQEVLFLEVNALHLLVALYQLALHVDRLRSHNLLLAGPVPAQPPQLLPHRTQVLAEGLLLGPVVLCVLQLPQLLLEEVGGELVEGGVDVVCCEFVHVGSGGFGDEFVDVGGVGLAGGGVLGLSVVAILLLHVLYITQSMSIFDRQVHAHSVI